MYLALALLLLASTLAPSSPVKLSLQLPVGVEEPTVYVAPNSTVVGLVTVESHLNGRVSCTLEVTCHNCTLLSPSHYSFTLRVRGDSRSIPLKVAIGSSRALVEVKCMVNGSLVEESKAILLPREAWRVDVDLIMPSDPHGNLEPRRERFTVVAKPSYTPSFLRLITGGQRRGHLDLLTLACIVVEGPGRYTVALLFRGLDGRPLPVSSSTLEARGEIGEGEGSGVIVLSGIEGGSKVVFPIFTPAYPESLVGTHEVEVLVYPYGSSRPVASKTYRFRVVSTRGEALLLTAFSALVALPFFAYTVARYVGGGELKDVVMCSLLGCLAFAVVTLPGQVVWGVSAILGPFDWLVHGVVYDALLYMLYVLALALRPRVGTMTMVLFVKWVMYSLFFGRLSVISVFWQATTCLFFEPLLYLAGVTRGKLTLPRLLAALLPAGVVDRYVDLMLYAALYRLYYADWYVVVYSVGNALYTVPGIVAGLKLAPYVRGVVHE